MIDLEFSKYYPERAHPYGPYRCACAPGHKCQACRTHPTVYTDAYKEARRATISATADECRAIGPAVRSLASRRAELHAFAAIWLAETGQFPLPSEMIAMSRVRPRPAWYRSASLVYYAYESFWDFYEDCIGHGVGSPLIQQQAADRLAQRRLPTRPRRKAQEDRTDA